jgi:low affinity sulfate transporter 2
MVILLTILILTHECAFSLQIAVSFAKIIVHSVRPQVEILGRFHDTDTFCNTKQYPMVGETPTVLTARIGTSFLCFVNANSIRERYRHACMDSDLHSNFLVT